MFFIGLKPLIVEFDIFVEIEALDVVGLVQILGVHRTLVTLLRNTQRVHLNLSIYKLRLSAFIRWWCQGL